MTTLGIIGTGLMGGSIGMRARQLGWRVIGCDTPEVAEEAVRVGAIDEFGTRATIVERADAIVIATHIAGTVAELEELRFTQPARARLIIDVSSVKGAIVQAARGVRNFVATHPMAGRERSGPAAAAADLFEGRTWLYVPSGDSELDARAVEFIGAMGATSVEVDAQRHDRIVAFSSHMPQVLGTLFAREAAQMGSIEAYMGPAARELMRLSRSSDAMWHDILEFNSVNVCERLRALAADLTRVCEQLERGENLYSAAEFP